MKITSISVQAKNKNRVNISVDGKYRFSLDVFQVSDLSIKTGDEYTEADLNELEEESAFGKLYTRALEYCLMRPHSAKEVRDYLYKKTLSTRTKTGSVKEGVTPQLTERVFERLSQKGYIDDEKFTRFWVENRHRTKGVSQRKLQAELRSKGVDEGIISRALATGSREDSDELRKIVAKKRSRYTDDNKFIAYLMRAGFSYSDIRQLLDKLDQESPPST